MSDGSPTSLIWGAADWMRIAAPIAALMLILLVWGYWRAGASAGVRVLAGALKLIGVIILLLCLLEPLFSSKHARPGANVFIVLADNSQSMTRRDRGADQSRAQQLKDLVKPEVPWLGRVGKD